MPEEEPEEKVEPETEEEIEKETVEEPEEEIEEKSESVLESTDIASAPATPLIVCQEDSELMEVDGVEIKEVEERGGFLGFGSSEEFHTHLRYKCPTCGKYYYHDMETKRQGCFIATAAYGTPLAKEINVLRKFRDSYLVHRNWGKKLVNLYYTLSPPVANLIEKSETLKRIVRTFLQPVVDLFKRKYKQSESSDE